MFIMYVLVKKQISYNYQTITNWRTLKIVWFLFLYSRWVCWCLYSYFATDYFVSFPWWYWHDTSSYRVLQDIMPFSSACAYPVNLTKELRQSSPLQRRNINTSRPSIIVRNFLTSSNTVMSGNCHPVPLKLCHLHKLSEYDIKSCAWDSLSGMSILISNTNWITMQKE